MKKGWKIVLYIFAGMVAVIAAAYVFFYNFYTFTDYQVYGEKKFDNSSNNNFVMYKDYILKYSRDGAMLQDIHGQQIWNQSYEMSKPVVQINGDSILIADQGGTKMSIFDDEGLKGEISTGLLIEKAVVAANGVTAVVLGDDKSAKIVCYDTTGSILVENNISVLTTGYPIGLAISSDGCTLMASYLLMEDSGVSSRIVYYDFSDKNAENTKKVTTEKKVDGVLVPEIFYLDNGKSVAVGKGKMMIFSSGSRPKLESEVTIKKEIKSLAHWKNNIAAVTETYNSKKPYNLSVYNSNGREIASREFKGDYSKIYFYNKKIVLDSGTKFKVFTRRGNLLYDGTFGDGTAGLLPLRGSFKMALIGEDGIKTIVFFL